MCLSVRGTSAQYVRSATTPAGHSIKCRSHSKDAFLKTISWGQWTVKEAEDSLMIETPADRSVWMDSCVERLTGTHIAGLDVRVNSVACEIQMNKLFLLPSYNPDQLFNKLQKIDSHTFLLTTFRQKQFCCVLHTGATASYRSSFR